MADEPDLLNALAAAPADDLLRQVYADWLDENPAPGRAEKAEYLRLTAETATAAPDRTTAIELRLVELSAEVPPEWAATASKRPIENCAGPRFYFKCPLRWEALAATDRPTVRFCNSCNRDVFYCETIDEANDHAGLGRCVAIDVGQPRMPDDLNPPWRGHITMGVIIPAERDTEPPSSFRVINRDTATPEALTLFRRLRRRLGL